MAREDWDRQQGGQGGRWRNEYERSFSAEEHHDEHRPQQEGSWQYGSQGRLRDNERWQNQSRGGSAGWQGGAQAGRYGEGYGSGRGSPRGDFRGYDNDEGRAQFGRGSAGYGQAGYGGYGSSGEHGYGDWRAEPERERYSGYRGSNYGYGRSGTPGSYEGGGYARDRYYASREAGHDRDTVHFNPHDHAPDHDHHQGWGHDNPGWERDMQAVKRAHWGGEGYGGPIEGPTFEGTRYSRREQYGAGVREPRRPGTQRWPKSYQRSDERIREDIYERLLQDHYIDCSNITVVVSSGNVTLEGTVPERHMKHQVENVVDDCSGVKDIDNKLRVSQVQGSQLGAGNDAVASGGSMGATGTSTTSGVRSTTPEPTSNWKKP
jgi:osmotically-inducible protein OsmY